MYVCACLWVPTPKCWHFLCLYNTDYGCHWEGSSIIYFRNRDDRETFQFILFVAYEFCAMCMYHLFKNESLEKNCNGENNDNSK